VLSWGWTAHGGLFFEHMKYLRLFIPVLTLAAAFLATSGVSYATKEISKKEKKACPVCHPKGNLKQLNDVGKHYKEKGTLEGAPKS
jgi:hypothetical protein